MWRAQEMLMSMYRGAQTCTTPFANESEMQEAIMLAYTTATMGETEIWSNIEETDAVTPIENVTINEFSTDLQQYFHIFNKFIKDGTIKSKKIKGYIETVLRPMVAYLAKARTHHKVGPPGGGVFFCHGGLCVFHNEKKNCGVYVVDRDIQLHIGEQPISEQPAFDKNKRLDLLVSRACDKKFVAYNGDTINPCDKMLTSCSNTNPCDYGQIDEFLKSSIINGRYPRGTHSIFPDNQARKQNLSLFIDQNSQTTVVGHTPYGPIPVVHKAENGKYLINTDTQYTPRKTNTAAVILDKSGDFWILASCVTPLKTDGTLITKIEVLTTRSFLESKQEELNGVLKFGDIEEFNTWKQERDSDLLNNADLDTAFQFSVKSQAMSTTSASFEFTIGDPVPNKSFTSMVDEAREQILQTTHELYATCGDIEGSVEFFDDFKDKVNNLCDKKDICYVSIGDVVGGTTKAGPVHVCDNLNDAECLKRVNNWTNSLLLIGNRDLNKFRMIEEFPKLYGTKPTYVDQAQYGPIGMNSTGQFVLSKIESVTRPKGYNNFTGRSIKWKNASAMCDATSIWEEFKHKPPPGKPISQYYKDNEWLSNYSMRLAANVLDTRGNIKKLKVAPLVGIHVFTNDKRDINWDYLQTLLEAAKYARILKFQIFWKFNFAGSFSFQLPNDWFVTGYDR